MVLIQTFVKSVYIFNFYMYSSGLKRLFQRDMNLSSNLFLMQVSNEDVLKYFDRNMLFCAQSRNGNLNCHYMLGWMDCNQTLYGISFNIVPCFIKQKKRFGALVGYGGHY